MIRIQEGKQMGLLYHYTSVENLLSILEDNALNGNVDTFDESETPFVSLTRDKNLHKSNWSFGAPVQARLVINGDRLSDFYKIFPYNDFVSDPGVLDRNGLDSSMEFKYRVAEERILGVEKIDNLSRFLVRVELIGTSFDIPEDWDEDFGRGESTHPELVRMIDSIWFHASKEEQELLRKSVGEEFTLPTRYSKKYIEDEFSVSCGII